MEDTPRRLMWHGMFLFLLGLLTGFLEPHFINMRMGLAAHLEGVMNGIFLVTLGCAWSRVRLAPAALAVAFWTVLYSAYVNWLSTTLAALWGTAALSPLTGMSHRQSPGRKSLSPSDCSASVWPCWPAPFLSLGPSSRKVSSLTASQNIGDPLSVIANHCGTTNNVMLPAGNE